MSRTDEGNPQSALDQALMQQGLMRRDSDEALPVSFTVRRCRPTRTICPQLLEEIRKRGG